MKMNVNKTILEILNKRNVRGDENIEEFLSPLPKRTYDPFLLLNMREGVDLILDAAKENKKICIYGDYDSDGITSVSILKLILDTFADNVSYYIPSRFEGGYGLSKDAIKNLYKEGIDLIITVDCGIRSIEEVKLAKELRMEIIITDHHSVGDKIPECVVINPKQLNCQYPFKELAGCGVVFKLCQAIQRTVPLSKYVINNILDIVAIGTIGDIVPLLDENRTIVKFGLAKLRENNRVGMKKLCEKLNLSKSKILSEDIAYSIVPHLNAAGRMEEASIGVELFTIENELEITKVVEKLIELNNMRKITQKETYKKCLEVYEKEHLYSKFPIVVVEDGHEGVTGIVAGQLKDYTQKPIAVLTGDGENYKGTSRSIESVDIYKIFSESIELFEKFGGHKGACGFSIKRSNLESLRCKIDEYMTINYSQNAKRLIKFDADINSKEINLDFIKEMDKLEPFGHCNEKPIFKLKGYVPKNIKYMGEEGEHVRFSIKEGDNNIKCVYFNYDLDKKYLLEEKKEITIFGKLNINKWKGTQEAQFMVTNLDINLQ